MKLSVAFAGQKKTLSTDFTASQGSFTPTVATDEMNMTVAFAEQDEALSADFSASATPFSSGFGEVNTVHDGQNGATFTPSVSADGIISWTNDRDLPNPEPVCIKGADGKDGADGADGKDGKDGKDGIQFVVDQTLALENGVLSVNTANVVEADNTLPVTSAAVNVTVGNINALLATI